MRIIRAELHDAEKVAEILYEAFYDDPFMKWMFPTKSMYGTYFLAAARRTYIRHREVYLDDGYTGAAMWLPPGTEKKMVPVSFQLECFFKMMSNYGVGGILNRLKISQYIDKQRPKKSHYYLHAVGVRSNSKGKGIGSALLKHVLEKCDREKHVAYLENSNSKNLGLYKRHGFEIVEEVALPENGPTIWFMKRENIGVVSSFLTI